MSLEHSIYSHNTHIAEYWCISRFIYLFIYLDCDVMSLKLCAAALCLLRAAYFSATALIFVLRLSCNNPSVCPSYFKTSAAVFKVKSRQLFEMLFFLLFGRAFHKLCIKSAGRTFHTLIFLECALLYLQGEALLIWIMEMPDVQYWCNTISFFKKKKKIATRTEFS